MAVITLKLLSAPDGQRRLVIGLESDGDTLPHEHERDHRKLVNDIGGNTEGVTTERIKGEALPEPVTTPTHVPERQGVKC